MSLSSVAVADAVDVAATVAVVVTAAAAAAATGDLKQKVSNFFGRVKKDIKGGGSVSIVWNTIHPQLSRCYHSCRLLMLLSSDSSTPAAWSF